ncbi:hypothetical protein [Tenacibaculum maritimum]|uniref:hypothetical protein n=1 Tax=Tenacibaculum maritimum TaxID=107401 RepID=UPI0012E50296|nr:hypothetical protein [Tenacibaculum maritimum]CAA0220298.1 conserved hypothetical protein [Tenacibaculum maritimum]
MRKNIFLILLCFNTIIYAQKVFEYNLVENIEFKAYTEAEGKIYKISKLEEFKQNTPENAALSSFFAFNNDLACNLYLDKDKCPKREDGDFALIRRTKNKDAYIQIHHRTDYKFEGNDMAYIMFTAKVKNIPFPFPTILSLIKKGNKWYLFQRPNQQKLTKSLLMFKPCVLSNLIEGVSTDNDINTLISETKSNTGNLDFAKLFDELVLVQKNKNLSSKLTMTKNADCSRFSFKDSVHSKTTITGVFKNVIINEFKDEEQNQNLISKIKKNNDSIVLKSKLDFEYSKKNYSFVKFNRVKTNGNIVKDIIRLDKNNIVDKPSEELIFFYEKMKIQIFSDLTPSMKRTSIMDSELYKKSRGVYDVLNISKLFTLYKKRKELFKKYLDN